MSAHATSLVLTSEELALPECGGGDKPKGRNDPSEHEPAPESPALRVAAEPLADRTDHELGNGRPRAGRALRLAAVDVVRPRRREMCGARERGRHAR